METKHTPGQWEISKTINDYAIYSDNNPEKDIAFVYQYSRNISKEEAEANAALIAAAPDILNALKLCQHQLQTWSESDAWSKEDERAYKTAQAAINKATNQQ